MEDSSKMLLVCKHLFGVWNQIGVRYCHWKSNEHLMDGLQGETDLDVYVFPEDKSIAEIQLKECHYIKVVPQKSSRYPMVDEWIGFDMETGRLVHIHLHYQIITGTKFCKEYVFPIDDELIKTRELDDNTKVYLASPEIEMIVLFARIVLKSTNNRNITTKGYDAEVTYLKQRINKDVLKDKCKSLIGERGGRYYELILTGPSVPKEWKELKAIIHSWLDKYRKMSPLKVLFKTKYYWIKFYVDKVLEKFFHYPVLTKKTFPHSSISICFIGQDGSGKSTLSKDIEKWFRWKIDAHRFYLGSGEHYKSLIKCLLSKAASLKRHNESKDYTSSGGSASSENAKFSNKRITIVSRLVAILSSYDLTSVARRAYYVVRQSSRYSSKGAISLFDRFPQNQFYGIYDGPKIRYIYLENGYNSSIIQRLAVREEKYIQMIQEYQPSLVFKLILSPEESIRRKPFENYNQICKKNELTKTIVFNKSEVHSIDAVQPYDSELLLVKKLIWDFLVKIES